MSPDLDQTANPPPQNQFPSPAPIEPQNNVPAWAFAVFLLAIAGIACIPILRHYHLRSQQLAPKAVAVAPRPATPKPTQPLTENDIEVIFSRPLQMQAEELLDRSIHHDPRALQLLEQHLGDWKGRVRESPRMKELLNRAQYSRDLRVRYAYCDMTLVMDGWSKDSDAVQILVQRAQNDPSSRAYDVWFLGMLGGRGAKPDQVRTVLLDYAHNDPDANVRQWATEGLRFLGTDQALDDLFEIFVSDPSFNVRDRAGCNLSDCGNFTRKQRMRMFPRFLDLVENPATNAQMRSWSFLAMQEITDVSLPPDAKAWRQWYTQHGAEKMAEFQSIPEWQVRGDE
jgi:hypothetical protein